MFHLYGLFIGIAIVVGWSIAEKMEPKISKIAPWVIILGIVGARVYHVVDYWEYYRQNLSQILMLWRGGLSIWGGLIGGMLGLLMYQQTNKLTEMWSILGAVATALPMAQAIGRVGNGVNHEFTNLVYGVPWWGAEAMLDLMLFVLLRGFSSKWRVGVYLVGYGFIRYFLQPYR